MFTVATVSVLSTLVAWAVYNNYAAYTTASQSLQYSPEFKGATLPAELLENAGLFETKDRNPNSRSLDIKIMESGESDGDRLDHIHDPFSKPLIMNRGNEKSKSGLLEAKLPVSDRNINENESDVGSDIKDEIVVDKEFGATGGSEDGSSDAETEKEADGELRNDKIEITHTKDDPKDKAMKIKNESEKVNAKKSNGKDENSLDKFNTEKFDEHKLTSPDDSVEQESLQEITKNIMNMSKNVYDLIIGDASKALGEFSSEISGPTKIETFNAMNNSVYVLYTLVSYILYKENDELHLISEKANKDILADSKFGGRLVPPAALEQMKRFSEDVEDVIQQFSDFRHRKMEINAPHMENGNTHFVPENFIGYIKHIGWEACVTITAVVVLLLVLLTFAVVWGTQYMRKRRNRIRLLRIQANENHQTI